MSVKLVNLGLPKSGTTTLARALRRGGWSVADHKLRAGQGRAEDTGSFVARHIYDGYFDTGDPFARLGRLDALSEISALRAEVSLWPQCDYPLLKAMRLKGNGIRFVATWRPPEEIADSMRRWGDLGTRRLPQSTVPGLPRGYGRGEAQLVRWIEDHYQMLRDVFGDAANFLELPIAGADARDRLAAFTGLALPWWGRANINRSRPERGVA
jgi:hypothetical protein